MTALLESALAYAARRWRVFPVHTPRGADGGPLQEGESAVRCSCGRPTCEDIGKHPRTRQGVKDASTDESIVQAWWTRWTDANIGIATGSGLAVLDIDGPEELQRFQGLIGKHGTIETTAVVKTGRGLHFYFQGELERSRKVDGLLLRGEGGYVIAPPSIHRSGVQYQWVTGEKLAELPGWFLELGASGESRPAGLSLAALGPRPAFMNGAHHGLAERVEHSIITPYTAHEHARISAALQAIPADCERDPWLHVGMALHALRWDGPDGDLGFTLWRDWSATCPEKFSDWDVEQRWRSFGRTGRADIGIGTLFHYAEAAGWRGIVPTLEARSVESDSGAPADSSSLSTVFAPMGRRSSGAPRITPVIFPDTDARGNPRPSCHNTAVAIRGLGIACAFDTFHGRKTVGGQAIGQWAGELTDDAIQMIRVMVRSAFGFDPGVANAHDAAVQLCLQNPYDPILDYLNGLSWDGVGRLKTWLHDYMGAEGSDLNAAFGILALAAAVRRVRSPGSKFDQIIVLESEEGKNKSTAIEILAGRDNFSDQNILTLDDKGQQEALQGIWLYEIADLAGLSRADVERVKAFASRKVDRARPAYGRTRMDIPRRCVLFATTNHDRYLQSQTGNRRFWPVKVGRIDLERLERDRDQLWAEAAAIESAIGAIALPESLWGAAGEVQNLRLEQDPWVDILEGLQGEEYETGLWTKAKEWRVSTLDIMGKWLELPIERQSPVTVKRLAHAMRTLKWDGPKVLRFKDGVRRGYVR